MAHHDFEIENIKFEFIYKVKIKGEEKDDGHEEEQKESVQDTKE